MKTPTSENKEKIEYEPLPPEFGNNDGRFRLIRRRSIVAIFDHFSPQNREKITGYVVAKIRSQGEKLLPSGTILPPQEIFPPPNCCKTLWSRVAVKPLMTRTEVAEYLGVSAKTIRRYEENGLLPRIDLSRTSIRYRPEAVEHLLDELTRKKATFRMY